MLTHEQYVNIMRDLKETLTSDLKFIREELASKSKKNKKLYQDILDVDRDLGIKLGAIDFALFNAKRDVLEHVTTKLKIIEENEKENK